MRRLSLLYLAGLLVVAFGLAKPAPGLAAYGSWLYDISSGNLNQPAKVAVDSANGDVYVTDAGNKKVKKYDKDGNYVSGFDLSVSGTPVGIGVNTDNIFVGDDTNDCVWIYNKSGSLADLSLTGTSHKLAGTDIRDNWKVKMPNTVAVAPSGHIFVVDGDNDKVLIYASNGGYVSSFGTAGTTTSLGTTIYLYYPTGIAFSNSTPSANNTTTQYFYLGDQGNYRVQKLSYVYSNSLGTISTMPTFVQNIGLGKLDSFNYFLRVSDVAWDSVFSRLFVADSLQMVAQIFDSSGNPLSPNKALNYNGTVQTYLNIPTGIVYNASASKVFAASNQSDWVAAFDATEGAVPAITALTPTVENTIPASTPYSIDYTVTDTDSASVTMKFHYFENSTPLNKVYIGSQTATISGGTYSGSYGWDYTTLGPGTYKVYATAIDDTGNIVASTSAGTIVVTTGYDGCAAYTNAMFAKYGPALDDADLDGLTNCEEVTGVGASNYTSDPGKADTDGDGLDDQEERDAATLWPAIVTCQLNPNNADSDNGGVSDKDEIDNVTDPCNTSDDYSSTPQQFSLPIKIGNPAWRQECQVELKNILETGPVVVDLQFTTLDGVTVLGNAKGINIPAKGVRVVKVDDYTSQSNVMMNIRASAANAIVGYVQVNLFDYYDPQAYFDDYGIKVNATASTSLVCDMFNDEFSGYKTWLAVRNPSPTTPVDFTMYVYKAADGTVPTGYTPISYNLAPMAARVIKLSEEGVAGGQYNVKFESTGGPISGYMMQVRMNGSGAGDPNVVDFAYGSDLEPLAGNKYYADTFNDGSYSSYITWIGIKNPDPVKTATVKVDYYKKDPPGSVTAPAVFVTTKYHDIAPNGSAFWSPCGKTVNGGDQVLGLDGNGNVIGGQLNAIFTAYEQGIPANPLPVGIMYWTFKKNANFDVVGSPGYKVNDYCEGGELSRSAAQTFYVPYWNQIPGAIPGKSICWLNIRNVDTSAGTVTVYVYDVDGNLNSQKAFSLAVNDSIAVSPIGTTAAGCGATCSEGSIKVVSTVNITGFTKRFKTNYKDSAFYDKCNSILFMPAP